MSRQYSSSAKCQRLLNAKWLFLCLTSLLATLIAAASPAHSRSITTIGARSCEAWIEAANEDVRGKPGGGVAKLAARSWLGGYVSGLNTALDTKYDLLESIDLSTIADYVDTYCEKNRSKHISDAADELVLKLLESRTTKKTRRRR